MQVDLNKLEIWTKKRQMEFNVSKCSYLQIGKKSKDYDHGYLLCHQVLKNLDYQTYLEVCLQSNFKWDCHINRITSTATQRLAQLRRILKHANTPTKKIAY